MTADTYFQPARERLIARYKLKFDSDGRAPIHKRVLTAFLEFPQAFHDVGIRIVPKRTASVKVSERGYWELFTPRMGAKSITKEWKAR